MKFWITVCAWVAFRNQEIEQQMFKHRQRDRAVSLLMSDNLKRAAQFSR